VNRRTTNIGIVVPIALMINILWYHAKNVERQATKSLAPKNKHQSLHGPIYGLIGLGVMGRSLALNMHDHGLAPVAFSIDADERNALRQVAAEISICDSLQGFVAELSGQRTILLMVTAGPAVDQILDELLPQLKSNDRIIDGGNSLYLDTQRRVERCEKLGIHFMGVGISGGEVGARKGASVMVGGSRETYLQVEPLFTAIACDVSGEPCHGWMGEGAAGHFVKTVHNGIEYGVMQLIAEAYDLLHRGLNLPIEEISTWFTDQKSGPIDSYLIDITAAILQKQDSGSGLLLNKVVDRAGQKGTGRWCVDAALALGVPVPTIVAAVTERKLSGYSLERSELGARMGTTAGANANFTGWKEDLQSGLLAGMLAAFLQGLTLIESASQQHRWLTDIRSALLTWRGGCIIRCVLLEDLLAAVEMRTDGNAIWLVPDLCDTIEACLPALRRTVLAGVTAGIPVPALCATLAYYDSLRSARLPTNLIQAQRDCFGAHRFERTDCEGSFHAEWLEIT